jgi:hypothetical protein
VIDFRVTTVTVGANPTGVGIMPPPPGSSGCVPFLAFNPQLAIRFGHLPNTDAFTLQSSFTLSGTAPGINPVIQPVTLQTGTFTATIPPGSFKVGESDLIGGKRFLFVGVIDGAALNVLIALTGTQRYTFQAVARGASLTGTTNPVPVGVTIGGDCGTASVTATMSR